MPHRRRAPLLPLLVVLGASALAAFDSTRPAAGAVQASALGDRIQRLVKRHGVDAWQVGIVVLDVDGKPRVSLDGARALSPASNQKVLTVGAALGSLGPDFHYETVLAARAAPRDGAVGDLVVKGDGDPNISGRFHAGDSTAVFKTWAAELRKAGLRKVTGDLVVDDSRFDAVRFPPGWKENQAGSWYSAEVGALNLNDNVVEITVRPTRAGQPAKVEVSPPTSYVTIENACQTAASGKPKPILHRKPGTNTIAVKDSIGVGQREFQGVVTVLDPGLFFGNVLAERPVSPVARPTALL